MKCLPIDNILNIIYAIHYISMAAPVIVGIFLRRSIKPQLFVIVVYTSVIFLSEAIAYFMADFGKSNAVVYSIAPVIEYCFLTYFFSLLTSDRKVSLLLKLSIPILVFLWGVSMIINIPCMRSTSWYFSLSYLLLIVYSIYSVIAIKVKYIAKIIHDARFWAIVTILVYTSGDLITCIMSSYFLTNLYYFKIIWVTHLVLAIFINICWVGVFLCQYRHPSSG